MSHGTVYALGIVLLEIVLVLFVFLFSPWRVSKAMIGAWFLAILIWPIGIPAILIIGAIWWMINHDEDYVVSRRLKKKYIADEMKRRMTSGRQV